MFVLDLLRQRLCICFVGGGDLQSSVLKSLFVSDSQEWHRGIAGPPKACRLTLGL